jgi:osmotically-inducible protein OsmY
MKPFNQFVNFFLVILLASLLGCASTATSQGTGEYVDDSVITAKVKAAIFADETLKSTEINVETFKGVVQLSGFVKQPADIARATEVARGVKGVVSVKNDMLVKGNQ